MTVPLYGELPLLWDGKSPETIRNDCTWLESTVRNAAPFTDWWVKARIAQLAHPKPPVRTGDPIAYQGLRTEQEIVDVLKLHCHPPTDYPDCYDAITQDYVTETLNRWWIQQFSLAIGRNFEVYASRHYSNVFLVTSTAPVSLDHDAV